MEPEEVVESPEDILEELRRRPGWWFTYSDLDHLALQSLERGCLKWVYDAAMAKMATAWSSSSKSSGVFVVYGSAGRSEDDEAFLHVLRQELLTALADY